MHFTSAQYQQRAGVRRQNAAGRACARLSSRAQRDRPRDAVLADGRRHQHLRGAGHDAAGAGDGLDDQRRFQSGRAVRSREVGGDGAEARVIQRAVQCVVVQSLPVQLDGAGGTGVLRQQPVDRFQDGLLIFIQFKIHRPAPQSFGRSRKREAIRLSCTSVAPTATPAVMAMRKLVSAKEAYSSDSRPEDVQRQAADGVVAGGAQHARELRIGGRRAILRADIDDFIDQYAGGLAQRPRLAESVHDNGIVAAGRARRRLRRACPG